MGMNENTSNEAFGAILLRERKKQKMSLATLASKIDKTASYLNRLERGESLNPTFEVVCSLISNLSLDVREVFKSFGLENILPSNVNENLDKIEDIIRLSNIRTPLIRENDISIDENLGSNEKEIIISIIQNIFEFSIQKEISETSIKCIQEIVAEISEFKEERQNRVNEYWKNHYYDNGQIIKTSKTISVNNIIYNISMDRKVLDKFFKITSLEVILSEVEKLGNDLINIEGNFVHTDMLEGITIFCAKEKNNIIIIDVIKNNGVFITDHNGAVQGELSL